MKQSLYTCCRCGREERTAAEQEDAPKSWATVNFYREYDDQEKSAHTRLSTHACGDCCDEIFGFLTYATPTGKNVDAAFDDGGTV